MKTDGLGLFIREIREKARLTQADLANRTGISRASISQLEIGKIEKPKLAVLTALANGLGIAPHSLFELAGVNLPDAAALQLQWMAGQLDEGNLRRLIAIGHVLLQDQHHQQHLAPLSDAFVRPM